MLLDNMPLLVILAGCSLICHLLIPKHFKVSVVLGLICGICAFGIFLYIFSIRGLPNGISIALSIGVLGFLVEFLVAYIVGLPLRFVRIMKKKKSREKDEDDAQP